MKIITKDVAFIQKKDIVYLLKSSIKIPEFLYLRMLSEVEDISNKYEFVKFSERGEIKFLKNMDWIIDYKKYKKSLKDIFK